jgi:two-component system, NtrC family, sensor kinase
VSLRARLSLSAALVVATVVGVSNFLQARIVDRTVEAEAVDAAAAIALGVSADLGEHKSLPATAELEDLLADYRKAVPAVRSITVTAAEERPGGVVASTVAPPPARAVALGDESVSRGQLVTYADDPVGLHFVAVPLERQHRRYGAVVVAVGMDALDRVRHQTRTAAFALAVSAILLLVVALDLVGRRLVHRPLRLLLDTMRHASAGDMQARAPSGPRDEIGEVAEGLNAMLDRMSAFNDTLRAEVERATAELREANRELLATAQRLFAARRELAASQRLALAGQMAASVAHQIGTPLNVISGHVQILRGELEDGSPEAERLGTVQEQIARVTAVVQSLLDRTRRPPPVLRPMAPASLLEGLAELVRPALRGRGIELTLDVEPGLPAVGVERGQIEQGLLNLITNAIDAMPEGGRLELRARLDGERVCLSVEDTGDGIAPEDLPRVFEPLFTTKPTGKGTGLGLPIVREVVTAHGGTVSLEGRTGGGTRATVHLPVTREIA